MSIEVMRQALEALENCTTWSLTREQFDKNVTAITVLRTAIAEAEKQEPVAWLYRDAWGTLKLSQTMPPPTGAFPVYTTPPAAQRQWVGLTDEQIDAIFEQHHNQYGECESPNFGYERAIEAKLKEKNK